MDPTSRKKREKWGTQREKWDPKMEASELPSELGYNLGQHGCTFLLHRVEQCRIQSQRLDHGRCDLYGCGQG
jgi:hypothetical protein